MTYLPCPIVSNRLSLLRLTGITQMLIALSFCSCSDSETKRDVADPNPELSAETLASQVAASLTEEETLALADELRVRPGELALFDFWDVLRDSEQRMLHLGKLPVENIILPDDAKGTISDVFATGAEWADMIDEIERTHGYTVTWSRWQHLQFDPKSNPPQSAVETELHFHSGSRRARTILKAELDATWSATGPQSPGEPPFTAVTMRVTEIAEGRKPVFHRLQEVSTASSGTTGPVLAAPILVRDLNSDHYPEVLLLGASSLLWNQANCTFVSQPLIPTGGEAAIQPGFRAGAFGEFTGDGRSDLMLIDFEGSLFVLPAAPAGAFTSELLPVANAPAVPDATKIIVADIDGDGDEDAYIAQDKPLFVGGQMPSPSDNAASGNPGFMLRNDGQLEFTDITDECGLKEKRLRRVRDARFHDYDGDGDPDLFLASAFAPMDVLENRDTQFADVSSTAFSAPPAPLIASGMTFADFNGDGILDLGVAAIESTSGARIEAMRARSETSALDAAGELAASGIAESSSSRLLLNAPRTTSSPQSVLRSNDARTFQLTAELAGTGWANDATFLDYDNDGDLDLYVTNGNITGESTRDFDLHFWQRELNAATSLEDPVIALLFTDKYRPEPFQGLNEGRISWQGNQANRFFRNDGDARMHAFHESGFLMGAALTDDCRATEAVDLDLDGKIDLLVVTQSWQSVDGQLLPRQSLTVLRNEMPDSQTWIGFQFDNIPQGRSVNGTKIVLQFGDNHQTLALEDGQSTLHLGFGNSDSPSRAEIHWPDGIVQYIESPPTNRYVSVRFKLE